MEWIHIMRSQLLFHWYFAQKFEFLQFDGAFYCKQVGGDKNTEVLDCRFEIKNKSLHEWVLCGKDERAMYKCSTLFTTHIDPEKTT